MRSVLRNARLVGGPQHPVDLVIAGGDIVALSPAGSEDGDSITDLDGGFVMRGLWDEHVHFEQWTLAGERLDLGDAASAAEVCADVAQRLRSSPPPPGVPLMGAGYRDAAWPDRPSLTALDEASGSIPVALVGMDMHSAWLNSAAFRHYGVARTDDGMIREADFYRMVPQLNATPTETFLPLMQAAAERASALGLVGIVDLEMVRTFDAWPERYAAGIRGLRVECGVYTQYLDEVIANGWHTGSVLPGTDGRVTIGPFKVVTDGSLNTRTACCWNPYPGSTDITGVLTVPPGELVPLLQRVAAGGLLAAVHAIGDRANTLALDAFEVTGARGRIEHAQLLRPEDLLRFARLGVGASLQPAHAVIDRDVADNFWRGWTERSFPLRSLQDAGVTIVLGSDAPCAPLNPWVTIAAAIHRSFDDREPWHPEQELTIEQALNASTRGRFRVEVGDAADLVVLDDDPLTVEPTRVADTRPRGTLVGGEWTARR